MTKKSKINNIWIKPFLKAESLQPLGQRYNRDNIK